MKSLASPITTGEAATSAGISPTYKWWVLSHALVRLFFNYADRQAINSVFPLLEKQFGFDEVQLGLIGSVFAWVYAGFALPAGLMVDRARRKTVILAACVVWSMFTLATAWCGTPERFHCRAGADGPGRNTVHPGRPVAVERLPRTRYTLGRLVAAPIGRICGHDPGKLDGGRTCRAAGMGVSLLPVGARGNPLGRHPLWACSGKPRAVLRRKTTGRSPGIAWEVQRRSR